MACRCGGNESHLEQRKSEATGSAEPLGLAKSKRGNTTSGTIICEVDALMDLCSNKEFLIDERLSNHHVSPRLTQPIKCYSIEPKNWVMQQPCTPRFKNQILEFSLRLDGLMNLTHLAVVQRAGAVRAGRAGSELYLNRSKVHIFQLFVPVYCKK